MHLILTGATGLVGNACLYQMIRNPAITKISILSRRPVPQATASAQASQKCTVILHRDFSSTPTPDVLAQLQSAHGCIWALGVSTNDVDKEMYRKITLDYPLVFARAFAQAADEQPVTFVYVSGEGATAAPSFWTPMFGVVKGQAEEALLALPRGEEGCEGLRVLVVRPAAVDPAFQPEIREFINEREKKLVKRLERPIRALLRPIYKNMISPTRELGEVLVDLGMGDGERQPDGVGVSGEGRVLGNARLRVLAGI